MATSSKARSAQQPAEEPPEQVEESQVAAPAWPEAPRMWTEEELTHTTPEGVWAPALKEHWPQAEAEATAAAKEGVTDNG